MTYDISAPYWWTRPWGPEGGEVRTCDVYGLTQCRLNADWFTEDGGSRVDASIAPLILKLNMVGIRTQFCCSGLEVDHRGWTDPRWVTTPQSAYISFEADLPEVMRLLICAPLAFDGPTFIRALPDATEEALATAWRVMEERLDARVAALMAARQTVGA